MNAIQIMTLCLNAATLVIVCGSVIFARATGYYTRQGPRVRAGLPMQPKPLSVRIADRLMGVKP